MVMKILITEVLYSQVKYISDKYINWMLQGFFVFNRYLMRFIATFFYPGGGIMKGAILAVIFIFSCLAVKCYGVDIGVNSDNSARVNIQAGVKAPAAKTVMYFLINEGVCPSGISTNLYIRYILDFSKVNDCRYTFTVPSYANGYTFDFKVLGTIVNSGSTRRTLSYRLTNTETRVEGSLNVPPLIEICSATVNNLTIGNIVSGSSPTSISLPISISGSAGSKSLVVSGADIQSDGKLNLGGSSSGVKVYPASNYISGSTWNAGSSSGSIPLTVDASAGKAGTWTSSLLATLTCS